MSRIVLNMKKNIVSIDPSLISTAIAYMEKMV